MIKVRISFDTQDEKQEFCRLISPLQILKVYKEGSKGDRRYLYIDAEVRNKFRKVAD